MPAFHADAQSNGPRGGCHEDIVISGMSGRFPECDSIEEFKEALYAGVDLITDDDRRWTPGNFLDHQQGLHRNVSMY